eukprot:s638_g30.t1
MSAVVEAAAAQAAQRVSEQFEEDFVKYNRLCVLNERQNRALHQTHFEMHCEMTGLREQVAELTDLVNEQKREVIQLVNMMKKQKTPENRSGPNAARSPAIVPVTKTKAASAKAMAMSGAARVMKKDKVNGKNPGEIYAGTPVCSQDQGEEGNAEVRKGHQDRCIQRGCAQQRGQPWLFPVQITTPILCAAKAKRSAKTKARLAEQTGDDDHGSGSVAAEAVAKAKAKANRPRASAKAKGRAKAKSARKKAPKAKAKTQAGRKKKADVDENPFLQPPPPGQRCISLSTTGLEVTEAKQPVEADEQVDPTLPKKESLVSSSSSSSSASSTSGGSQKSPEKSCLQFEKVGLSDDEVTEWVDKNGNVYVRKGDFDSVLDVEFWSLALGEATLVTSEIDHEAVTDLRSMFSFAERSVKRIYSHFGRDKFENLVANTDDFVLLSLYSGVGGAELSLGMLHRSVTKELKNFHDNEDFLWMESPRKPFFFASCDVDSACQKVLDQHKDPSAYIIADILDFIKPEILARMESLVAAAKQRLAELKEEEKAAAKASTKTSAKAKEKRVRGRGRGGGPKSRAKPRASAVVSVPSDGCEFLGSRIQMSCEDGGGDDDGPCAENKSQGNSGPLKEIGERLLADLLACLEDENVFRQYVPVMGGKTMQMKNLRQLAKRLIMMQGSVCKDWSTMNQGRQELLGAYILPFACSLGLARLLTPMCFLHECTRLFRPAILQKVLPEFSLHHSLLDPRDFGFPVRRSRAYSALIRPDYVMTIPSDQIKRLFSPCRLGCGVFFQATDQEVAEMKQSMAAVRLKPQSSSFRELLPPQSQVNLLQIERIPWVQEALAKRQEVGHQRLSEASHGWELVPASMLEWIDDIRAGVYAEEGQNLL